MPIYDYECEECKKTMEVMQKVSDKPLEKCETCGGPVRKIINKTTFHLHGPGFYVTDNKRKYLK